MKRYSLLLAIFLTGAVLRAEKIDTPKDDVAKLKQLIEATEETLHKEKKLLELLVQYKQAELLAIKDPENTDNLLKLVQLAKATNDTIKELYLEEYFSPQFLEELNKLAQIATKKTIPAPK